MEEREEEEDGEDYDAPRSNQEGSTNRKESEKAGRDSDEEEVSENDEEPSEWQLNSPKNISAANISLPGVRYALPRLCLQSPFNPHNAFSNRSKASNCMRLPASLTWKPLLFMVSSPSFNRANHRYKYGSS